MYNDLLLNRMIDLTDEDREARIQALIEEVEALDNLLSPEAQNILRDLRPHTVTDDVYEGIEDHASLGERMADRIATVVGSWFFILFFLAFMGGWVGLNLHLKERAFDTYPFILLNLGLSTLAGLQAPIILMAQNRQSKTDRAVAHNDYQVNLKNELEIVDLHRKLDTLTTALDVQTRMMNSLIAARRQEVAATVQAIEQARMM
ncbi:MAG: hypothetical protein OHK0046_21020 [Anaerolineae bacterium]